MVVKQPSRSRCSSRRHVHASEVIDVGPSGEAAIAVVADTHGRPHPNARKVLEQLAPRAILHGGDIGELSVLAELGKVAPVLAVRGNIDAHTPGLYDSMDIDFVSGERSLLKVLLTHIAVYGPKLRAEVASTAREHAARVVLCGHSHVPFIGKDKGIIVFNPGSIGPRRFTLPIVLGVLQLAPSGISLRHIDCETGETWLP